MKTLMLTALLLTTTVTGAQELLIFKRLSDDIGTRQFPIYHTVWPVDALTFGTTPLLQQANALGGIEGQQLLEAQFNAIDSSLWVALWAITFAAREKMAVYGLTQVPSAVWLDSRGEVIKTYPAFTHVDQLRFDHSGSDTRISPRASTPTARAPTTPPRTTSTPTRQSATGVTR